MRRSTVSSTCVRSAPVVPHVDAHADVRTATRFDRRDRLGEACVIVVKPVYSRPTSTPNGASASATRPSASTVSSNPAAPGSALRCDRLQVAVSEAIGELDRASHEAVAAFTHDRVARRQVDQVEVDEQQPVLVSIGASSSSESPSRPSARGRP